MKLLYLNILLVLIFFCDRVISFEPVSVGILGGIVSGIYYIRNPIIKYTICKATECCNEDYIIGNFQKLREELDKKVYGQHIAKQVVLDSLISHWYEEYPQKALTMSFHGWPGSGKNYVTQFIKESLYKEGSKSKFVHHFMGRIHFPSTGNVIDQQSNLQNWIKGNVSQCERSLFIFDEVDKMPEGILNAIKPMIDHNDLVENVDYRRAIFIFLSNTGGDLIKDHLLQLWEKGIKRNSIALNDFENIISMGAFNEKGGFHESDTIKSCLIDHYIPYFPLEKQHVELCIKDQFKLRGITEPQQEHIEEVMSYIEWGPPPKDIFSKTGCKRISQKVALVVQKYKLQRNKQEHTF